MEWIVANEPYCDDSEYGAWAFWAFIIQTSDGKDIALVKADDDSLTPSKEGRAMAHLMAAAPELLAACKRAVNYIDDTYWELDGEAQRPTFLKELEQAIAKAEGK